MVEKGVLTILLLNLNQWFRDYSEKNLICCQGHWRQSVQLQTVHFMWLIAREQNHRCTEMRNAHANKQNYCFALLIM